MIKTTAIFENGLYKNFGINKKTCNLFGYKKSDIVNVRITISKNKNDKESPEYWGWFDNEKQKITLIWYSLIGLRTCFEYSLETMEKLGHGKAIKLEVKE